METELARADVCLGRASMRGSAGRGEIVVISEHDDAHVPLVQAHLRRELIVVDPMAHDLTLERGGNRGVTIAAGTRFEGAKAVWYRKPLSSMRSLVDLHVAPDHRRYSRLSMGAHAELLHDSFGDARWVSDVSRIIRAENKALQLELAEQLGMLVPHTVMTNDPETATAFLEAQRATIIKPLCGAAQAGGQNESFWATRVHGPDGIDLSHLRWAPAIFQQAITATADVRVTIVGQHVFAARIDAEPDTRNQQGVRDWRHRQLFHAGRFHAEPALPRDVRHACLALTRALGLEFAAIDLVIDDAGNFWFLELNPNGQWGFVELDTGLPIGAALAELLEQP